MKVSDLIKKATDHLVKCGDTDVRINLLTENSCNFLDDMPISICNYHGFFEFEIDVDSKENIISRIK